MRIDLLPQIDKIHICSKDMSVPILDTNVNKIKIIRT